MKYERVHIDAITYDLPPVVVTSEELEERLAPVYASLHIPAGQLESLTGISERRWWPENHVLSDGAIAAAHKAFAQTGATPGDVETIIYAGVNRDQFEPATACRVAATLGVNPAAAVYDISNACLGVLNGMLDLANRIELGQIRAGLVVSCETAREIVEDSIDRLMNNRTIEQFVNSFATLTGGSGAVAVLMTDGSFDGASTRRLLGGTTQTAPEYHGLCRWGLDVLRNHTLRQLMITDAAAVMKYGVELGKRTWEAFLHDIGWGREQVDKVICHQVGMANQKAILSELGIPESKDFQTFPYLGNIGTVSLPLTAALADERGFLQPGDRVGLLGIGSGLNCLMLGVEW
ncbi:MAG: 3-oxoacyl-ACP synthase III [Candidatus Hydrogenedentes bacterium]|nr:3-oxoacyl-ACP synthase III [Candidatus Hydrogenedentota bacterium]MBI3119740.1 3-oxoacyl-ACP synthase III [Candidatus Hydrogenedentota bacterium]